MTEESGWNLFHNFDWDGGVTHSVRDSKDVGMPPYEILVHLTGPLKPALKDELFEVGSAAENLVINPLPFIGWLSDSLEGQKTIGGT